MAEISPRHEPRQPQTKKNRPKLQPDRRARFTESLTRSFYPVLDIHRCSSSSSSSSSQSLAVCVGWCRCHRCRDHFATHEFIFKDKKKINKNKNKQTKTKLQRRRALSHGHARCHGRCRVYWNRRRAQHTSFAVEILQKNAAVCVTVEKPYKSCGHYLSAVYVFNVHHGATVAVGEFFRDLLSFASDNKKCFVWFSTRLTRKFSWICMARGADNKILQISPPFS